ncbi:hypothetical protein VTJ04DRAFT_5929 [Mycothermus thermophilus]|uniref:uncharacterized protein n=1 Tax=Humicola insolens TaxID=85995 RepID=UPI003743747F
MPIRNPFARRPSPGVTPALRDEKSDMTGDPAHPGFERVDTVGSGRTSTSSIFTGIRGGRRSQDTGEYKMSVVDDSGVYLPPSPTEREAVWPRRYLSRTSSDHRRSTSSSGVTGGEIEHFPISRESFDSYRRSFDITARNPITTSPIRTGRPRQSLDSHPSRTLGLPSRSDLSTASSSRSTTSWAATSSSQFTTPEEDIQNEEDGAKFEEVQLDDDDAVKNSRISEDEKGYLSSLKQAGRELLGHGQHHQHQHHSPQPQDEFDHTQQSQQQQQQKKRGLFSFGRSAADGEHESSLFGNTTNNNAHDHESPVMTAPSANTSSTGSATGVSRFLPSLPVVSLSLPGRKKVAAAAASGGPPQEAELKFMGVSSAPAAQEVRV